MKDDSIDQRTAAFLAGDATLLPDPEGAVAEAEQARVEQLRQWAQLLNHGAYVHEGAD